MSNFFNFLFGKKNSKTCCTPAGSCSATTGKPVQVTPKVNRHRKPQHEEIAARAYEIWEREGRPDGKDSEHWIRAEEELTSGGPLGGPMAKMHNVR